LKFTEVVKSAGRKLLEANLPFRRAKYGKVSVSVGSWLQVQRRKWKIPDDRLDIYEKAYSYYLEHEFGRPIINLTASATFGKGVQFAGDNEQVAFARKLFSDLDYFQVGIESGIYSDNFIRLFNKDREGKKTDQIRLAMLPPATIDKIPKAGNVLEVEKYVQKFEGQEKPEDIPPEEMVHIMINAVSDSLYGNSDLLHLFYHLDMYNSLVEEADKRRLFASQPVWVFEGVDLRYRAALKSRMGDVTRDVDQKKGIRRSVPPGSVFYLPKGMTLESKEPAGKFDLEGMINRVAKVIAMSSETPLHWLNLGEEINRACYSEDTETLTKNGWKYYWEIQKGEKIATFNPNTEQLEYHIPTAKYIYDYIGLMYHFKNARTDILVTPEHRMHLREAHSNKWKKIEAKDIKYRSFYFKEAPDGMIGLNNNTKFVLPFVQYHPQSNIVDSPVEPIDMGLWMKFLGWYLSEGYCPSTGKNKTYPVNICQKGKESCAEIRDILTQLPWKFNERDNGSGVTIFTFFNKSLRLYLQKNVGSLSQDKRIPREFLMLPTGYLQILLDVLLKGDGHVDLRSGRKSFMYASKSRQLADDFQTLVLHLGYSSRKKLIKRSPFQWYEISCSTKRERQIREHNISQIPYQGKVYCYEVSNHLFITRRNGKIGIHFNTAKEMAWPFVKKIQRRQILFVAKFEELLRKVYAKLGDKFPHDEDNKQGEFKLQVVFPPIFDYELEEIQKMVQSILNTNMAGKLSNKSTLDLVCNYFGLDVEKEEEKLEGEKKKEAQEEFGQVEKAVGEIGRAVAKGELEKDVATKLINKILEKK